MGFVFNNFDFNVISENIEISLIYANFQFDFMNGFSDGETIMSPLHQARLSDRQNRAIERFYVFP